MGNISYPYTQEELYNNYEFKVIRKAIMREFPWIKDVSVTPENLEKYNLIFVDFDIDPIKLGEEMGWKLTPWVKTAFENDKEYHGMYLSLFFQNIDQGHEDVRKITQGIIDLMNSVGKSPAFPPELRLKGDRKFVIGDFFLNKGSEPW
jgi:hypothetical protein